ncbi:MAG TPA: hypothetical protein VIH89_19835 [Candidatus Sulfotelmatobacter sp.]
MLNTSEVNPEKLTLKQILSVRCPMCRAKPKEKCTLTTGHPSDKTHLTRGLAAAKVSRPENSGQAALRIIKTVTNGSIRAIFQRD